MSHSLYWRTGKNYFVTYFILPYREKNYFVTYFILSYREKKLFCHIVYIGVQGKETILSHILVRNWDCFTQNVTSSRTTSVGKRKGGILTAEGLPVVFINLCSPLHVLCTTNKQSTISVTPVRTIDLCQYQLGITPVLPTGRYVPLIWVCQMASVIPHIPDRM